MMSIAENQRIERLLKLRNDLLDQEEIDRKLKNQNVYSTQDLQDIVDLTKEQNEREEFVKMYRVNTIASFMLDQLSIRRRKARKTNFGGFEDVIKEQGQNSSEKVKLKGEETSYFTRALSTLKNWVF